MAKLIKVLVVFIVLLALIFGTYIVFSRTQKNSEVPVNNEVENQIGNETSDYVLKTPTSYRMSLITEGPLFYFGSENSVAFTAEVFPFTLDEEKDYLHTLFEGNVKETSVTIGSRSGIELSGILNQNERRRWYGSATSSDPEQNEFVIFPLADGVLRITAVRHFDDLDTLLSGLDFSNASFVPFRHEYKTYTNTDYGFELMYPTNTFKSGLGKPELHLFTDAEGRTSISFGAYQADPIFNLIIIDSLKDDQQYNEKLKKGDYTYRAVNGNRYIEMEFPGYDDGGGNAIYIPHNGYVLRVSTEGYGTSNQGETGKRIAEGILNTIRFIR